ILVDPTPTCIPDQPLPLLKSNAAAPLCWKAKPDSGPCRCTGEGKGLDSCGALCCAASPYTSTIPTDSNYYGGNPSNLCFERATPTPD
ncbi:MAG: hypothetical protein O2897_03330, partial [bacterium]|nr:hypothetical protein [bacterium]